MNTNYRKCKAKAIIGFCFFWSICCLSAQNTGNYKYIINPDLSWNTDVLHVDNRYYVLSNGDDKGWYYLNGYPFFHPQTTVTIFDEQFNKIKQLKLLDKYFDGMRFFYEDNSFYVFGYKYNYLTNRCKICIAKFDEDFNLIQPLSLYNWDDNYFYTWHDIIRIKKNEFMLLMDKSVADEGRFWGILHIGSEGEFLQDVFTTYAGSYLSSIVETDNHYIVNSSMRPGTVLKFCKDSLEKYESLDIGHLQNNEFPDDPLIAIDNQLIFSNLYITTNNECEATNVEWKNSLVFLNEDMSLKKRLVAGIDCEDFLGGRMAYTNPDSIYHIHRSSNLGFGEFTGFKFVISNFSKEGELNFTDILEIRDSLPSRLIRGCKVLPNGNLLAYGLANKNGDDENARGFILLYNPTWSDMSVNEPVAIENRNVFPNPTQSKITVTNAENAEIQLFNILGQKLLQSYSTEENAVINIGFLPQGLYVVKVVKEGACSTHKIQVIKN